MNHTQRIIFYTILFSAIFLRLSLAIVNREANDDHIEVIRLIVEQGRLPLKDDCWECFQPKLFHYSAAGLIKLWAITDPETQIVLAQGINFLVSLLMLWGIWNLLKQIQIAGIGDKILAFGLIALNPALVAINIQATNDTFVISFSTLAILFTFQFILHKKRCDFVLMVVFSALAVLSKSNGAVTVMGIVAFLITRTIYNKNIPFSWTKGDLPAAIAYGAFTVLLVVINPLGQYLDNLKYYGTPVTINMERAALPSLFEPTEVYRPGIISIQDGFFTFKFLDLLKNPQITRDNKSYPAHRTSFWTILYARTHFIHYNPWPLSWITDNRLVRMLGRIIYILALLPTSIVLLGVIQSLRKIKNNDGTSAASSHLPGLFLLLLLAYLGFAILYAIEYRIYTAIKAIFIYPVFVSIGVMYLTGSKWLMTLFEERFPKGNSIYQLGVYSLLIVYVADIFVLIIQLVKI
jgi:hypothetical protein